MGEIYDSLLAVFKNRTTSAAVGSYLFFWVSYHWQAVYATLFVNEDKVYGKYHLLKNEYINEYFLGVHSTKVGLLRCVLGYLVPLILTVIFIWPLPKYVLIHFYRAEQEHKTERLRVRFKEDQKRKNFEISAIRREEVRVTAKTSLAKKKKVAAATDPKIVWDGEYEKFKKDPAFKSFTAILRAVYEHGGQTRVMNATYRTEVEFEVPGGSLLVADTLGLVTMEDSNRIHLTAKGKYFASRYPLYTGR